MNKNLKVSSGATVYCVSSWDFEGASLQSLWLDPDDANAEVEKRNEEEEIPGVYWDVQPMVVR